MSEIVSYFLHPEVSMDILLGGSNEKKWQDGIKKCILVAILSALLTMAFYRYLGITLEELGQMYYGGFIQTLLENSSEGTKWLICTAIAIIETLLKAMIKCGLWIGLLYIISKVVRDRVRIYQIVLTSIYATLIWSAAQIVSTISMIILMISPIRLINQMVEGISMIFNYWYLIIFIIGYSIESRSSILKAGCIVLIIQGVFWAIG